MRPPLILSEIASVIGTAATVWKQGLIKEVTVECIGNLSKEPCLSFSICFRLWSELSWGLFVIMAIWKHLILAQQQAPAVQNFIRNHNSPNPEGPSPFFFFPGNWANSPINIILSQWPFSPDYPWSLSTLLSLISWWHIFSCLFVCIFLDSSLTMSLYNTSHI